MISPLLKVSHLQVRFRTHANRAFTALEDVSFEIARGSFLSITGESGSGKTTIGRAVLGLLPHSASPSGSIVFDGEQLIGLAERRLQRFRGRRIGMILQEPALALNPTMRIGAQVAESVTFRGWPRRVHDRSVLELFEALRLPNPAGLLDAYPHELSGGMQQRVGIAMSLVARPELIIADEITRSLDALTLGEVLTILNERRRRDGMSLILITHDIQLAAHFSDDMLLLKRGRIVQSGSPRALLATSGASYIRELMGAARSAGQTPAPSIRGTPLPCPLLRARNLRVVYRKAADGGSTRAVDDVSLDIYPNEILSILGASGSGKTSLAKALTCALQPSSGSVHFDGQELTGLRAGPLRDARRSIQMVFQDPRGSLDPTWTVASIVAEPFGAAIDAEKRRQLATQLLEDVGLDAQALLARKPRQLSGGECQRVAIARALAARPKLLICDEAVASLDPIMQRHILGLLKQIQKTRGLAVLFITHDLSAARQVSDRVCVMKDGQLCESGDAEDVFSHPKHPYTSALVATFSDLHKAFVRAGDAELRDHGFPLDPFSVASST